MANDTYDKKGNAPDAEQSGTQGSDINNNSTSGSRTSFNRGGGSSPSWGRGLGSSSNSNSNTGDAPDSSNLKQAEESGGSSGGTSTPSSNTTGNSAGGATSSTSPENQSFYRPNDLEDKESSPNDSEGGLYNASSDSSSTRRGRLRFQVTRRRAVGGGIAGIFVGVAIGGLSVIQGPMQFVHFSQLLQKFHLSSNEDFGDDRTSKVLLYGLLGKGAERGRLSITGNKAADAWEKRLVDRFGVRPVYTTTTGRFAGFQVLEFNDGRGLDPNGKAIRLLQSYQDKGQIKVRQGNDHGGRQAVKPTKGSPLEKQAYTLISETSVLNKSEL